MIPNSKAIALAIASALCALNLAPIAHAAPAPTWVAPKQREAAPPRYPAGAHGDAEVVLDVVVAPDGRVIEAHVVSGDEPFASAAREAALAYRFDPATRDGVPIRATVRARIAFTAAATASETQKPTTSAPATTTATTTATTRATAGATSTPEAPTELTVEGTRGELGGKEIGRAELRVMPGSFGDPFRIVEAMPGVAPIISGIPYFYVRGAPPGNTGTFLDGIQLPLLFHVGAGPSVVAPALLDRVDLFSGPYPASYGRVTGGVLAGTTTPPAQETHGEWSVRLFDAGGMVETPLGGSEGREATLMVGGRYGYPGLALSIFSPSISLAYWDYQARLTKKVSDRDQITLFVFGDYDSLYDKKGQRQLVGTQFHRVDLRLDHALEGGFVRVAATLGYDRSSLDNDDSHIGGLPITVIDRSARLRVEVVERLSKEVLLRGGADVQFDAYANDSHLDAFLYQDHVDSTFGAWVDAVLRPAPNVEIVPGLRLDLFRISSTTQPVRDAQTNDWVDGRIAPIAIAAIDPRVAIRVGLSHDVTWISAFGVSHQRPAYAIPSPGFQPPLGHSLQEAWQFSQGLELRMPANITASAVVFHQTTRHIIDPLLVCTEGILVCGWNLYSDSPATLHADGLELLVRRDLTERFGFWLAYTLSRATESVPPMPPPYASPSQSWPSRFDRTHLLTAAGSVELGRGWRFGARGSYVSGHPIDPMQSSDRLPGYTRLDVRLEKRWQLTERRWVAFTAEWFNATLAKEVVGTCNYDGVCSDKELGPISIPSLGVEGGF